MRFVMRILLMLAAFAAFQGRALAYVSIDIDLSSQTMHVHSTDGRSYEWPISSGRAGHATPRGVFHPQRLYAMVHSAKYGNAPMPHSIFFTGQYAIHGTTAVGALGTPASHGCVRLSPANAAILFAMVQSQGARSALRAPAPARWPRRAIIATGTSPSPSPRSIAQRRSASGRRTRSTGDASRGPDDEPGRRPRRGLRKVRVFFEIALTGPRRIGSRSLWCGDVSF